MLTVKATAATLQQRAIVRVGRAASVAMLLASVASATLAAKPFEDTMAQRVLACTGCHGAQGRSGPDGYYPRIAGKPAGYLLHQLRNFRDGLRRYDPMTRLLGTLDDAYLGQIAEHFAAIDLPYPPPPAGAAASSAQLARGRQIVEHGDPARDIPACAACHGPALGGVEPSIPGLLGMPVDYLNGQLGAWRTGSRRAAAPDCMAQIAQQLSADDIAAASRWLASRSVDAASRPLASTASLPARLPMRCGSVETLAPR